MRYFIMKQDYNLPYSMKLKDFQMTGQHHVFYKEDEAKLNDVSFLYVKGKEDGVYFDFIQNPIHLVSEVVQGVLDMYEDDLIFKKAVLANKEAQNQKTYYHVLTDHIEGLSHQTPFYPDGKEKKVILDKEKIGIHKVFQLKDAKGIYFIISLEVVESLLRRKVQGILFEEVEVV